MAFAICLALFPLVLLRALLSFPPSLQDSPPATKIHNRLIRGSTEITIPVRSHTIFPPYVDSDLQNRFFDFGGSAVVETSRSVRLTQDRPSQAGHLWSRNPLPNHSFQVELEFKIEGANDIVYGDGLAVWLTKDHLRPGPVFGSADMWDGFGIFIDTFANSKHSFIFPRIMGMQNRGYQSYNVGTDGDGQDSGSCSLSIRKAEIATKLKVNYVRSEFLEVLVQYDKWDEWEHCFTVLNYTLPDSPYLGFSAHTGQVSDNHDVIYVSTSGLAYHPITSSTNGEKAPTTHKSFNWKDPGGGIGSGGLGFWGQLWAYLVWLVKWATLAGLVGMAWVGGNRLYASYQKETMKRF